MEQETSCLEPDDLESPTLYPVQRRRRIADFLQAHGAVTLQQLVQTLQVSMSTLRRDLDALAEEGVVERTHGGALLRHQSYSTFEPATEAARELAPAEKRMIGAAAAAALLPRQSVIFDSGSTVIEAARAVVERGIDIVAVTNDIEIARVLGANPRIQVHVLGGELRHGSNALLGEDVVSAVQAIHADVVLLGAHAVTDGLVSETSVKTAAVKQAFIRAANVRRLLVDSSKFRPRVFKEVCQLKDLDEIVTDDGAPESVLQALRTTGIKVTVAGRSS
jgi:DeoR family transcriptional regulator of aga operon